MHQSFSDNRLKSQAAARTIVPSTTALNAHQMDTGPTPPPEPRRLWASEQGGGDTLLQWRNVILIQHGLDKGFTQAPPRSGVDSTRPTKPEAYQGHVLQLMIAALPTDSIGYMILQALELCYPPGPIVPTPDTLHYTLGEHPSHLAWTHDRRPYYDTQLNAEIKREIFLSHDDRLECITLETATIYAFLPPPIPAFAIPPLIEVETSEVQQSDHAELPDKGQAYTSPAVSKTTIITLHWPTRGHQTKKAKNTVYPRRKPLRRTKYSSEFQTRGLTNQENRPTLRRCQFPHPLKFSRRDSVPYYPSPPTTSTSYMGEKFFTPGYLWHNRG